MYIKTPILPIYRLKCVSTLKKYVTEFCENIFSTAGLILYCEICDVKVSNDEKFHIQQYIGRDKYKNAFANIKNNKKV